VRFLLNYEGFSTKYTSEVSRIRPGRFEETVNKSKNVFSGSLRIVRKWKLNERKIFVMAGVEEFERLKSQDKG